MKSLRVVAFFDYIDRDADFKDLDGLIMENVRIETGWKIECINATDEFEFEEALRPNCIAVVDYGALNFNGHSDLVFQYDRFMLDMIENHPETDFVFVLTMGKEYYEDDLFKHPNVYTMDRCAGLQPWVDWLVEIR